MTHKDPQLLQMLEVGEIEKRRSIAYRHAEPLQPGALSLMWLTGLKSTMTSTKAAALAAWTAGQGLGLTRFDYSGHGQSEGRFEVALISDWLEEARAILIHVTRGQWMKKQALLPVR